MFAPVPFVKVWEFILEMMGGASLQLFHDLRDGEFWRVFDVHVDMIGADGPLENPDVFRVAHLEEELSAAYLHLACENVIAVLGDPDDVDRHPGERVAAVTVRIIDAQRERAHDTANWTCVSTEVLR